MNKRSMIRLVCMFVVLAMVMAVAGPVMAGPANKVNINKATAGELAKLNKVGDKYAERIVEYRKKNGPFKKPEDIMNVKGIGKKIFEANKDIIVVK